MSSHRQRSRHKTPLQMAGLPVRLDTRIPRGVLVLEGPPLRRDRATELADLTASECERKHLETVRPLLELAVRVDRGRLMDLSISHDPALALAAAVRIAGPCPAGWCRYPAAHSGECQPLEAA